MCSATDLMARLAWAFEMPMPCLRISRASLSWPSWRSSLRLTREKWARIFDRADGVRTMFSHPREGLALFCVRISTRSPVCRRYASGTMEPFTLAPTQWLPTSVWMA